MPRSPTAEAADLSPAQYRFESDGAHHVPRSGDQWRFISIACQAQHLVGAQEENYGSDGKHAELKPPCFGLRVRLAQ